MFDITEVIMNRLKMIARNSPFYACNLIKNMVLSTVWKGSAFALRFSSIRNLCNSVVDFKNIYQRKIREKYGLYRYPFT